MYHHSGKIIELVSKTKPLVPAKRQYDESHSVNGFIARRSTLSRPLISKKAKLSDSNSDSDLTEIE